MEGNKCPETLSNGHRVNRFSYNYSDGAYFNMTGNVKLEVAIRDDDPADFDMD